MFNLSVVNIVPNAHKGAINQIAELYGCGSNNLSVKLQGEDGIYWVVIRGGNLKTMQYSVMMNCDSRQCLPSYSHHSVFCMNT